MNDYLEAQIKNMIAIVRTFENSCTMAALKNNGQIDKTGERQLKKINAASEKFISKLKSIK